MRTVFLILLLLAATAGFTQNQVCENLNTILEELTPEKETCFAKIRGPQLSESPKGSGDSTLYYVSKISLDESKPGFIFYHDLLGEYMFVYVAYRGPDPLTAQKEYMQWLQKLTDCLPDYLWTHEFDHDRLIKTVTLLHFRAERQKSVDENTYFLQNVGMWLDAPDEEGNYEVRIQVFVPLLR